MKKPFMLALLISFALALAAFGAEPLELKFTAIDGREVDLAKLRGKVVLIDFWATWCAPCVREAPHLVALYNELHPKGFEVVGISLDTDKDAAARFAKKAGMTWPHWAGTGPISSLGEQLGLEGIPSVVVIDKAGKIAAKGFPAEGALITKWSSTMFGITPLRQENLKELLISLLAG